MLLSSGLIAWGRQITLARQHDQGPAEPGLGERAFERASHDGAYEALHLAPRHQPQRAFARYRRDGFESFYREEGIEQGFEFASVEPTAQLSGLWRGHVVEARVASIKKPPGRSIVCSFSTKAR